MEERVNVSETLPSNSVTHRVVQQDSIFQCSGARGRILVLDFLSGVWDKRLLGRHTYTMH